jgi:hypothetical protein|tara:strand:+ start:108 stop:458 length:351 start_codon:yes stop_codon:yes gene_type:complete
MQSRPRSNSFTNNASRNNFRPTQSPEKLLDKYNILAKEAILAGDKTLGENYLQHADHFTRIIEDRNKNREQSKNSIEEKVSEEKVSEEKASEEKVSDEDKPLPENVNAKQEEIKNN